MKILHASFGIVFFLSCDVFSISLDPEKYLVFNIQDEKVYKLELDAFLLQSLQTKQLQCYIKHNNLILGSDVYYSQSAEVYEAKMALVTFDEIHHGNTDVVTSSQIFSIFENLALYAKREKPNAFFSLLNAKYSPSRVNLSEIPNVEVITQDEVSDTAKTEHAYCLFY